MIKVETFEFSPFSENTYVVSDESSDCVVIDPGCYDTSERKVLADYLESEKLNPVYLLNTHCHIDHIFGNSWFIGKYGTPLVAHRGDMINLRGAEMYAKAMGLHFDPSPEPDISLTEGDVIRFGNTELDVLFLPGHAPGHVGFLHKKSHNLFAGDVLFQGSIGRCDLPGGNFELLMESIVKKVLPLGDEVIIHSGHGPVTTVGRERESNPFVLEYFKQHKK